MRCRQTGAQLLRDLDTFVFWQPPNAPQQSLQVFAVDVFHREEVLAVHFGDVVNAADVRMRNLAGQADLTQKMLKTPGTFLDIARQEFQGHRMPQLQVIRAIDLAHSAPAGERHDAIALGDFGSRQEAPVDGRIRVRS